MHFLLLHGRERSAFWSGTRRSCVKMTCRGIGNALGETQALERTPLPLPE